MHGGHLGTDWNEVGAQSTTARSSWDGGCGDLPETSSPVEGKVDRFFKEPEDGHSGISAALRYPRLK